MTDEEKREKVIRGLECCAKGSLSNCEECPYTGIGCSEHLCADALALLKEQDEGIEPEISRKSVTETTVSLWYKCGACGGAIEQGDDEFCRHCGKKVKWYG